MIAMFDDPEPEPASPAESDNAVSSTTINGGVNIGAQHGDAVHISGDVVGRDKIVGYTVEQVSTLLTQISSTFQLKPFDGRCPYLGLDAFSEEDADRFFGRETLVTELVARVKESRFVVIAGPSGSGKSSLVRAGLIYALKQDALPNSDRWLYAILTPGRDPIESLALAMSRLAESPDAGKYVRENSTEPGTLHEFAESQLSDRKDQRAVIFVDQFEEVFTQVSKEDERIAFLNLLTQAATSEGGRVTVLFALRSDFVSYCATYPQLNALLNQQFMQVGAMQSDGLVSAIARPALQVGLRIDPDLVAQIVNDMQDEPGALPLMQFALRDLFDAQQARGGVIALTLSDYLARGGLHKALERHADAVFARLSESEQQLAQTIFSGLIEIGRGTQDTRRTATFDELVPANVEVTQFKAVMQKLADARLLTTDERDHHITVTIAHETLIDAWPWLRKLINENREAIAWQNQIAEDAQEWNEHQHDASYLYSGARLATALEKLAANKIVLSGMAQAFIDASVRAQASAVQREKARQQQEIRQLRTRNRIITTVGLIAVAAMLVAMFFGVQSNQNADTANRNAVTAQVASTKSAAEADSRATAEADALMQRDEARHQSQISFYRQLAAQTMAQLSDHFDLALLLSIETARIGEPIGGSYESRDSLLKTLETDPTVAVFRFGNSDMVKSLAVSPDGKTLASGGFDGSIVLWDVATRQRLGEPLTGNWSVYGLAFSPDGKMLASGGLDQTIMLWDVATRQRLGESLTGHTDTVLSVAFSPDGKTLASGSSDRSIILWDVATRQRLGEPLTGHTDEVLSVAFSPDGKTLASGSSDESIILWDVATRQRLGEPLTGHSGPVSGVAFSPSEHGKTLASGSWDGSIILWDVATRQRLGEPLTGHAGSVDAVAFSPDGKILASGSSDKSIILWDLATHQRLGGPLIGHADLVSSLAFTPDGKTLISGSEDMSIIWWDMATRQRLGEPLSGHADSVTSVAFSPDGKILASGSSDKRIILWDAATRQRLGEPLTGHSDSVLSIAFSPDGKTLASGSSDKSIILWDVATRQRLAEPLTGHAGRVWSVAFSPNGQILASASSDGSIILWDVATHQRLGEPLTGHAGPVVWSVAFSSDGKMLASGGSDHDIILWDVATHQRLGEPLTGHTGLVVSSVAFSPDGRTLASGSIDQTIILWDVATRQRLGEPLTGHSDWVRSVTFSPDGKTLASGSSDKTIILWDVATRQRLGEPLAGHSEQVLSVAFSPDGKTLASGSSDKSIILWDVDPTSWKARVCQIAGRNFTRSEWARYFGERGEPYRKTCEQWPLEPEAAPTPQLIPTP